MLSGGGGFKFSATLRVAGSLDNLRVKKGLKFSSIFCVCTMRNDSLSCFDLKELLVMLGLQSIKLGRTRIFCNFLCMYYLKGLLIPPETIKQRRPQFYGTLCVCAI